ncbi:MAG: hypothetical protein CL609_19085 [Anaerolineaceae bacterium]|nr:hypothetical protein [Anaerolineaceae bacterium]
MLNSIQKTLNRFLNTPILFIILVIGGMWLFRGVLLINKAFPFNADEAIVGLMAKHILAGARPIFFYGQVYMGSLDAYIISIFFNLFGTEIIWIRIVQIILFSATLIEFYIFMQVVFEKKIVSMIAMLFLAFPVVNVVLYTTVSLGGYGEAFLLGMTDLLLAAIFVKTNMEQTEKQKKTWVLVILGFCIGLGLWANALSLVFAGPAVIFILSNNLKKNINVWKIVKQLTMIVFGFFAGAFFWFYGFFANGGILLQEMFGSAVSVETLSFWERIINHLLSFVLFAPTVIFGFRPPWSVDGILLPLIPIVILFWIVTIKKVNISTFSYFQKSVFFTVCSVGFLLFVGFVFTSFGVDPSGRYFLPFVFLLSMLVGLAGYSKGFGKIYTGLLILVLFYQIAGSLIYMKQQPKITTQFFRPAQVQQEYLPELVSFLSSKNEFFGYSNYWVSYPLAFLSDEKIISVPSLPYHPHLTYTSRDSRIKDYEVQVSESEQVFYITTNNEMLDQVLQTGFKELEVQYSYQEIGDYHIYYELSEKVEPQQLAAYGLYQ